ncbi:MAG: signal peptidase II [Succinivibrionaceae bacterium]
MPKILKNNKKISIKNSGIWFLILSIIVFFLDYFSKKWIIDNIKAYQVNDFITVIKDFFNIVHVHNEGAAFSFLAEHSGWQQVIFGILAVGISLYLIILLRNNCLTSLWKNTGLSLIIGGALGNLYDRIVYGYVIDFLDFYIIYDGNQHHYPAFNIADCGICVGVFMIIIYELFMHKKDEQGNLL